VDPDKCIACGLCAEKCPKKVDDEYNEGLGKRKAIYVPYSQAVPLKYAIDETQCIYLNKNRCGICEKVCPSGAINFKDTKKELSIHVGSIIVSTGFDSFDPSSLDYLNFSGHPDIVTSMGFERVLSATGPTGGHLCLPSDKKHEKHPSKIAWLQCVGSRDENRCANGYCSSVCCMYAVKQAVMAREHSSDPLDCAIFYMDMRTQGKDFDRYVENAKQSGVRFVRSRVHSLVPQDDNKGIAMRYANDSGAIENEEFDMVVLSTGLEISPSSVALAKTMGLELDPHNFIQTDSFHPVSTSVPGIYACGVLTGPKDIPQSVMEASSAAAAATENISKARHTRTKKVIVPEERDVSDEFPRIGVFVCNCGTNIGSVIDVPQVVEYANSLPGVTYTEQNLFTCSQDTQDKMAQVIREQGLNRVVVAACSPKTHETLFQDTLVNAGLNKHLIEMANIRNQDSWVHSKTPEKATQKAKKLVRMAVAKSMLLSPLFETKLPVTQSALVVGGGVAGMTTALSLACQGFSVSLIEKEQNLGGNARLLHKTFMNEDIAAHTKKMILQVEASDMIQVFLGAQIKEVQGFVGNFNTIISNGESDRTIDHGVAVLATGAREYKPDEYLYGQHDSVLTHLDFDRLLKKENKKIIQANNIVFIQCVGSREEGHPYCSKVCCTHSIHSAIEVKTLNPQANVMILYRDIRTYGKREIIYKKARDMGILFFRYDLDDKPKVEAGEGGLTVEFTDHILQRRLSVDTDLLCLASRIEAHDNQKLAQAFKVTCDADGWLMEAHQKLRPVDFATEGLFLCGMAHYPKPIDESIAQAKAAASRAVTTLARETISVGGIVSRVNPVLCSGCQGCIEVCPYGAITMNQEKHIVDINSALCKGCGACAAACPSEALTLEGFNNEQLYVQIRSALSA
jgi:heterodisulfide reductase subunit A2